MKNAHSSKIITLILTVMTCAVILLMIACCFAPYYTISEPYHFILNPNPMPDHYSLNDVMWTDTKVITTYFTEDFPSFDINYFVTNMVLSYILGLLTLVSCGFYIANEMRRFPSFVSGVFTCITSVLWALFSLLAYPSNAMLDLGVPKFMGIRSVIIVICIVGAVLAVVRTVCWIITEIKVSQERKARLAQL